MGTEKNQARRKGKRMGNSAGLYRRGRLLRKKRGNTHTMKKNNLMRASAKETETCEGNECKPKGKQERKKEMKSKGKQRKEQRRSSVHKSENKRRNINQD